MPLDPCSLHNGGTSRLRAADDDHPVQILANLNGAKAYHADRGRFVVEYPQPDGGSVSVAYNDQMHAIHGLNAYRQENRAFERVTSTIQKATLARGVPKMPPGPTSGGELDPHLAAMTRLNDSPTLDTIEAYSQGNHSHTTIDKLYQGPDRRLGGMSPIVMDRRWRMLGKWGNIFADMIRNKNSDKPMMQGKARVEFNRIIRTLTPEEQEIQLHDYVHGEFEPSPDRKPVLDAAYSALMKKQNDNYYSGQALGIDVAKEIDYRWPHRHDMSSIMHPGQKARILESIMEGGLADSPEDALKFMAAAGIGTSRGDLVQSVAEGIMRHPGIGEDRITPERALGIANQRVDRYMMKNGERFSANIEKERLDNGDRYIKHVRAWDINFQDTARRLAEAYHFGPGDEKINEVIGHILMDHGGNPAVRKFITDSFDYEVGRKRTDVPDFLRQLMGLQTSKLSLSALWNLTGNYNTFMRVGPLPFIKGTGRLVKNYVSDVAQEGFGAARRNIVERLVERGGTGLHPIKAAWSAPEMQTTHSRAADDFINNGMVNIIKPEDWNHLPSTMGEAIVDALKHPGRTALKTGQWAIKMGAWPFNLTELYVNRGIGMHASEVYFESNLEKMLNTVKGSKAYDLYAKRFAEMGLRDPERLLDVAREGNTMVLNQAKQTAVSRLIEQTQFRPDLANLPQAAQTWYGKAMLQFKTYPINQMRFVMRELDYMKHGDAARVARALTSLTVGMPALGYALSRARANIMGETISTKAVHDLYNEPGLGPKLAAGALAMTTGGLLGIGMDTIATSAMGNKFAAMNLMVPASAGTMINLGATTVSAAKGLYKHDRQDMRSAYRSALSELGGVGQYIQMKAGLKRR